MLADLFVAFEMQIQIDTTVDRHGWSMQGHQLTYDDECLKELYQLTHSEREEIESVPNILFFDIEDGRRDLVHFDVTLTVLPVFKVEAH